MRRSCDCDRSYWISILIALDTGYQSGHSSWVVNVEKPYMEEYLRSNMGPLLTASNQAAVWSAFVTLRVIGVLVGAEAGGYIIDKYGRKLSMRFGSVLMFASCMLQWLPGMFDPSTPPMWWCLFVGRFAQCFGVGFSQTYCLTYIAEISTAEFRGTNTARYNQFSSFGGLLTVILGIPQAFGNRLWGESMIPPAMTSLISFVGSWIVYESPRHLIAQKKPDEARKSLAYYSRASDDDVKVLISKLEEELRKERLYAGQRSTERRLPQVVELCLRRDVRPQILLLLMLAMARCLSGYNIIMSYSNYVLQNTGIPSSIAIYFTLLVITLRFLASSCLGMLLDRVGRRWPVVISAWTMVGCYLVLCITTQVDAKRRYNAVQLAQSETGLNPSIVGINQTTEIITADKITTSGIFALIATSIWPIAYVFGVGAVSRIVVSEIFAQQDRATGARLYVQLDSLFSLVYTFSFLPLFQLIQGYTYLLIVVPLVPINILLTKYMPETKGTEMSAILQRMSRGTRLNESIGDQRTYRSLESEKTPLLTTTETKNLNNTA